MESSSRVRVYVRCRPLNESESRGKKCVQISHEHGAIIVGDKKFSFDAIFDEFASQEDVYKTSIMGIVEGVFNGFNGTIFACK